MKLKECIKHKIQEDRELQQEFRISGDSLFRIKCRVCGKVGPKRATKLGAMLAWNKGDKK